MINGTANNRAPRANAGLMNCTEVFYASQVEASTSRSFRLLDATPQAERGYLPRLAWAARLAR